MRQYTAVQKTGPLLHCQASPTILLQCQYFYIKRTAQSGRKCTWSFAKFGKEKQGHVSRKGKYCISKRRSNGNSLYQKLLILQLC